MAVSGSRQGDEWEVARRRNFRGHVSRWDIFSWGGGVSRGKVARITSIYFLHFPDEYTAKQFFELFACIGKVFGWLSHLGRIDSGGSSVLLGLKRLRTEGY